MDPQYFRLSRRPFRLAPDTQLFCSTPTHDAALKALTMALRHGGLALLEGEAGSGKSLIGLKLFESAPASTLRLFLQASPGMRATEFFQAILFDLGLPYQGLTEHELRLAIHGALLDALGDGRSVALLIDEAHQLMPDAFDELRLFGNLESQSSPPIGIVLLAALGFRSRLSPLHRIALQQRLATAVQLAPISVEESRDYIVEQLRNCGGRADRPMTGEAIALLAEQGRGTPRVLNRAAALAFQIAESAGVREVDAEAVLEALEQLELFDPNRIPDGPAILPMNGTVLPRLAEAPSAATAGEPARATAKKPKRKSA